MRDQPLLMVIDFGDGVVMDAASVERFAGILQEIQYGHADCQLFGVYAVGRDNQPVPVEYQVEGAHDFDEESWAHPKVTVLMPDGSVLKASYLVDGRA